MSLSAAPITYSSDLCLAVGGVEWIRSEQNIRRFNLIASAKAMRIVCWDSDGGYGGVADAAVQRAASGVRGEALAGLVQHQDHRHPPLHPRPPLRHAPLRQIPRLIQVELGNPSLLHPNKQKFSISLWTLV